MIRVIVADRHELFRDGLEYIFRHEKDIECVGIAEDGIEVIRLVKRLRPDIVILDIDLPKLDGDLTIKQIKSASQATRILILTHCYEQQCIESSVASGVDGYLLKHTPRTELMNAIRMIYAGEGVVNLDVFREMMAILTVNMNKSNTNSEPCNLHNRELQILKLVAIGISNKEIASKLFISPHTVGVHLVNIFKKLGVESRTEAVAYALNNGLIDLSELSSDESQLIH